MRCWGVWLLSAPLLFAEPRWIQGHSGQIEIFSDVSTKEAMAAMGIFEQFRYALGDAVGKQDLTTSPPIRLLVMKSLNVPSALTEGRDRYVIPLAANQPIPARVFRECTRLFLEQNIGRLPEGFEKGLEIFFSTLDIKGAHVMWGAPPPAADRTPEWGRVELIATKTEYYGKLRVLLFNLQRGADEDPAYRNAVGKGAREFREEAAQFLKAGVFTEADAPSRAFNAQRDVPVKPLSPDDARLAQADLLNDRSPAEYNAMIEARIHLPECYEGLGMIALRNKDEAGARENLARAVELGTQNGSALVAYAKIETDRVKQGDALEKVLEIEPKNAEAHYLMGLRKDDVAELKSATELAPGKPEYWDALALAYFDQSRFVDAGKAWRSAEQASTDPAQREKMRKAWTELEQKRLDHEDGEKKRIADQHAQEMQKLKEQAVAQLHSAEAKINAQMKPAGDVPVVSWDEMQTVHLEGVLRQVDCTGGKTVVTVESADHHETKLLVAARGRLICGVQKRPVRVAVDYSPKVDAKLGTAGELPGLQE